MAISNRWVCKSSQEYNLGDVKNIFERESGKTRPGNKFDELKHVIKLGPEILATNSTNYLPGTLYFEDELENEYYELTDSGDLEEHLNTIKTTHAVDFWVSDGGEFLFRNSKKPVKAGKELLSQIIFRSPDKINNYVYDIEAIEDDVRSGALHGMWTYSFRDRHGNITSGIAYGENINNDSIYTQTSGAPRNFIGVEKSFDDEIIKIRIYRNGTITILKNFESPTKIVSVFGIIEDFSKYATVPI